MKADFMNLNDIKLFLNKRKLQKLKFIAICNEIISQKNNFDESVVKLNEFLEEVEINADTKEISIDNIHGKFYGMWVNSGSKLSNYKFRTRKY